MSLRLISNAANQSLEDQFLHWRQDMETKKEELARQMDELQSHVDHPYQENGHLRARLEEDRGENARRSSHPAPPVKQNKDKEPILSGDSDVTTDDKLSFDSSPLRDLSPPKNKVEAESRKSPLCCSIRSVNGMPHRVRREINREQ